jgi:hypothetical protein
VIGRKANRQARLERDDPKINAIRSVHIFLHDLWQIDPFDAWIVGVLHVGEIEQDQILVGEPDQRGIGISQG